MSVWLRAMGMDPGDVVVEECQEIDGELIFKARRIERNGVVISRITAEEFEQRRQQDAGLAG